MSSQATSNNHPVTSVRGGASVTATPANSDKAPSQHVNSNMAGFHQRGSDQTHDPSYPPTNTAALKGQPRDDNIADEMTRGAHKAAMIPGSISEAASQTASSAANTVSNTASYASNAASNTASAAASTAKGAENKVEGLGSKIVSGVTGLFTQQPRMTSNTEQAANATKDAFSSNNSSGIGSAASGITSQVQAKVGDAFAAGKGSSNVGAFDTRTMANEFSEDYKLEMNAPGEDRMPLGMQGKDDGAVRR